VTIIMARRKRKQESLAPIAAEMVGSAPANTVIEPDNMVLVLPADDIEISSIVTKRLSSDNIEDVTEAMKYLSTLVFSAGNNNAAEGNRKTAFRRGAPLAVVQAMRRCANSVQIQNMGIRVLSSISNFEQDNFGPDIIALGGLECCLAAMKLHNINTNVQANGCVLIGNLWRSGTMKVSDEDGLKAVVKAMEQNKEMRMVQRSGCCALEAWLLAEEWVKRAVVGCIDRIIDAMNHHPDDSELQEYCCDYLTFVSKADQKYRGAILDAKIPVGEALRIYKDNAQVRVAARKAYKAIIA
jgi:hypothetical protein